MFKPKNIEELETLLGMYIDVNISEITEQKFINLLMDNGSTTKIIIMSDMYKILKEYEMAVKIAKLPTIFIPMIEDNDVYFMPALIRSRHCHISEFRSLIKFLDPKKGIILYSVCGVEIESLTIKNLTEHGQYLRYDLPYAYHRSKNEILKQYKSSKGESYE